MLEGVREPMKVICGLRGWHYEKTAAAKKLIGCLLRQCSRTRSSAGAAWRTPINAGEWCPHGQEQDGKLVSGVTPSFREIPPANLRW